ncbi:MAG: HNH endonuclease signature motif containing protein [Verrucomicrobiota bacterium]
MRIPACRNTTTEIAHIKPWAETKDHAFENLIALCPTCHTRYDKGEIDRKAMLMYKHNLGIMSHRYSETERRLFEKLGRTRERVFVLGFAGDVMVANAVTDGFFVEANTKGWDFSLKAKDGTAMYRFKGQYTYVVTDAGWAFIDKFYNNLEEI